MPGDKHYEWTPDHFLTDPVPCLESVETLPTGTPSNLADTWETLPVC